MAKIQPGVYNVWSVNAQGSKLTVKGTTFTIRTVYKHDYNDFNSVLAKICCYYKVNIPQHMPRDLPQKPCSDTGTHTPWYKISYLNATSFSRYRLCIEEQQHGTKRNSETLCITLGHNCHPPGRATSPGIMKLCHKYLQLNLKYTSPDT